MRLEKPKDVFLPSVSGEVMCTAYSITRSFLLTAIDGKKASLKPDAPFPRIATGLGMCGR